MILPQVEARIGSAAFFSDMNFHVWAALDQAVLKVIKLAAESVAVGVCGLAEEWMLFKRFQYTDPPRTRRKSTIRASAESPNTGPLRGSSVLAVVSTAARKSPSSNGCNRWWTRSKSKRPLRMGKTSGLKAVSVREAHGPRTAFGLR